MKVGKLDRSRSFHNLYVFLSVYDFAIRIYMEVAPYNEERTFIKVVRDPWKR